MRERGGELEIEFCVSRQKRPLRELINTEEMKRRACFRGSRVCGVRFLPCCLARLRSLGA
jgi:hypothetical protein